jgi:ankyrin repeat protein
MRRHLRNPLYLVVALWFSAAHAGSYDDWFRAIIRDNAGAVQALLQRGFDPNTPYQDGHDGLYIALREDALKSARVLIAWPKTNVDMRSPDDETPLMMAALHGDTAIAKALVDRGADVNKPGWAPLHYAATHGHVDIMRLLLDHDAYIDAESPNGTTPLMMAARYGTTESVKLLLDAGADPALRNKLGLTALDFAKQGQRPDAIAMLQSLAVARTAPASTATHPPAAQSVPPPAPETAAPQSAASATTPQPAAPQAAPPVSHGTW